MCRSIIAYELAHVWSTVTKNLYYVGDLIRITRYAAVQIHMYATQFFYHSLAY